MAKPKKAGTRRQARVLPLLDLAIPPEIRLTNLTAMKSCWVDPEDLRPNARRAREITGWRAYCPIRQALHHYSSRCSYTDLHVLAADRLRLDADAVAIGLSNGRDMSSAQSWFYGPVTGPSALALRNIRAWPRFRQAMALFNAEEKKLVAHVVLLNRSLRSWCLEHTASPNRTMQRLVELLDRLVAHYELDDRGSRSAA